MTDSQHEDRLGRLAEELTEALAVGEHVDPGVWADRFAVESAEVEACVRALRAFDSCLGEERAEGRPELPLPNLPDSFRIEGELGRGGMGVVYRATQAALGRTVAVKVLRPGELQFGDALRRFRDEARSLARLRHRHIVSIHDVGETSEGLLWYAMELVEGRTLAEEIGETGVLTPSRAVRVMGQVTSAIAHAHAQGIVHRDLKPQNVLIDAAGDAYVVDFGLARDAAAAGVRTLTGELLGTPAYMSPEQASGDHGRVGESTDVWALGALLYESLTGRGPFAGRPLHGTIRAILEEEPRSPRRLDARVPAELEAVALKALRKKPEHRYPTALAFGEELERFADGRGVRARNPNLVEKLGRATWRHRTVVGVAATVALLLGIVFGGFVVPEQLRSSRIADARRSFQDGYAGAAVEPLRELAADLDAVDPAWRDFDLLLLRALNARVAELLDGGQAGPARELFGEALEIAARRWRAGRPSDPLHVATADRPAWEFELLVCRALSGHESWEGARRVPGLTFDVGVLGWRFHRRLFEQDWQHPSAGRRLCAERVALEVSADPELGRTNQELHVEVLRSLVRGNATRIERNDPEDADVSGFLLLGWKAEQIQAWWSPTVEDALADLATDPDETPLVRGLALESWAVWTGMPSYARAYVLPSERVERLGRRAEAAADLVEQWRSWRRLDRAQVLRARIDGLFEGLSDDRFGFGSERERRVLDALGRWLGEESLRTGVAGVERARALWAVRRDRDPEGWVREVLGVGLEQDIDYADAVSAAESASADQAILWRHLAWLRLPAGIRMPQVVECSDDYAATRAWLPAWRRGAAGGVPDQYMVRMGVVMFRDRGAPPVLLGEAEQAVRTGERVQLRWRAPIPMAFGPRVSWRAFGEDADLALRAREHPELVIPPRWVSAEVQCELVHGTERRSLRCTIRQVHSSVPMDGGTHAGRSAGHGIGPGQVRAVDWDLSYGGSLRGRLEFVLLVRLDPAGPRATPRGDLATWRAGYEQLLADLAAQHRAMSSESRPRFPARARTGDDGWSNLASPSDFELPARWPMPAAAAALRTLAPGRPLDALPALWAAGVADDPTDLQTLAAVDPTDAEQWGLVALSAPSPELRSEGRRRLAAALEKEAVIRTLDPRTAELLVERRGDELDPDLASQVSRCIVGPGSPWLGGAFLAGAALALVAAAGLALAFSRHPRAAAAAWTTWIAAGVLSLLRFELDSFVGPPTYVLLLVAALAGSRTPRIRSKWAPRILATGVPLALAVWSFAGVHGLAAPPAEGAFWAMLLPAYLAIAATLRPSPSYRSY